MNGHGLCLMLNYTSVITYPEILGFEMCYTSLNLLPHNELPCELTDYVGLPPHNIPFSLSVGLMVCHDISFHNRNVLNVFY